ncbi:MAG: COG1615 family transporter, partial [Prochlorococcus sp.]|nr:COG1615 family transporter [Prochlorococcus sp.]
SGRIHLYIIEPDDPLIQGWQNVFPELFKSLDAMPLALREHLRVPTNLFNIQVQQLLRYHVTDPRVFYSGDDVWQVPMELYGKRQVPVLPYHTTAQLRPNDQSEFLLLQPLTPLARPNLSGWLAARSDGEHYGELVLLRFPSETLIFGPEQIQALINQNPTISQQFGLWDRAGSEVVQGNLLVVPLGNALLYVEPVYLKAQQGGLPTLARVVVSDGKRIAMAENLADGLRALLEGSDKRSIVLEVKNLPPSMMTGSE